MHGDEPRCRPGGDNMHAGLRFSDCGPQGLRVVHLRFSSQRLFAITGQQPAQPVAAPKDAHLVAVWTGRQ